MKIEKNIPMPEPRTDYKRPLSDKALNLIAMEPGDSFFIEASFKPDQRRHYNTVYKMAQRYNIHIHGRYFKDGIRIWKV